MFFFGADNLYCKLWSGKVRITVALNFLLRSFSNFRDEQSSSGLSQAADYRKFIVRS